MDHSGGEGWLHRQSADTRTTVTRQRSPDGAAVSKYTGVPGPQKAGGRRALRTGTCIFLLAAGTILWLALPGGTHLGVNLNIVGIIVVCAGLLGLILRRAPGLPAHADRLRRWVVPSGTKGLGEGPPGGYMNGYGHQRTLPGDGRQPMVGNYSMEPGRPTLADYLLDAERDPPL